MFHCPLYHIGYPQWSEEAMKSSWKRIRLYKFLWIVVKIQMRVKILILIPSLPEVRSLMSAWQQQYRNTNITFTVRSSIHTWCSSLFYYVPSYSTEGPYRKSHRHVISRSCLHLLNPSNHLHAFNRSSEYTLYCNSCRRILHFIGIDAILTERHIRTEKVVPFGFIHLMCLSSG